MSIWLFNLAQKGNGPEVLAFFLGSLVLTGSFITPVIEHMNHVSKIPNSSFPFCGTIISQICRKFCIKRSSMSYVRNIFRKTQPLPRSNFKKLPLAPHDFAGNFYLIWFVNCLIYAMPWIFHSNGWFSDKRSIE